MSIFSLFNCCRTLPVVLPEPVPPVVPPAAGPETEKPTPPPVIAAEIAIAPALEKIDAVKKPVFQAVKLSDSGVIMGGAGDVPLRGSELTTPSSSSSKGTIESPKSSFTCPPLALGKTAADCKALKRLGGRETLVALVEKNYATWVKRFYETDCKPFKIDKDSVEGLTRPLIFYSPNKIYLLENSHTSEGDPIRAYGGFKVVNNAWEIVSGQRKCVSSLSSHRRTIILKSGEHKRIHASHISDIETEISLRKPLKGKVGIIETEAVFRYTSDKTDQYKTLLIEDLYDGDLMDALIHKKGFRLSETERVSIARQILAGLTAIHQAGLIHRDIKPENILLKRISLGDPSIGLPKTITKAVISDFGLATLETDESRISHPGGTPSYFSPEYEKEATKAYAGRAHQISRVTTPSVDIYAMGITLHALFTEASFSRDSSPYFPASMRTEAAQPLRNLILKMTAPSLAKRATWTGSKEKGSPNLEALMSAADFAPPPSVAKPA